MKRLALGIAAAALLGAGAHGADDSQWTDLAERFVRMNLSNPKTATFPLVTVMHEDGLKYPVICGKVDGTPHSTGYSGTVQFVVNPNSNSIAFEDVRAGAPTLTEFSVEWTAHCQPGVVPSEFTSRVVSAGDNSVVSAAEATLRDQLKDPDSVQFRHERIGLIEGNPAVICGEFNSKNSYGGYSGYTRFVFDKKANSALIDRQNRNAVGEEGRIARAFEGEWNYCSK